LRLILQHAQADENFAVIDAFVTQTPWIENLAIDPSTRSNTSVCLSITDERIAALEASEKAAFAKGMVQLLEKENVALDIGSYRDAPSGLRFIPNLPRFANSIYSKL